MQFVSAAVEFVSAVALPIAVVTIALLYKKPIYALIENVGLIAGRASRESFELALGESFRLIFPQQLAVANTTDKEQIVEVASESLEKAVAVVSAATAKTGGSISVHASPGELPRWDRAGENLSAHYDAVGEAGNAILFALQFFPNVDMPEIYRVVNPDRVEVRRIFTRLYERRLAWKPGAGRRAVLTPMGLAYLGWLKGARPDEFNRAWRLWADPPP